MESHFGNIFLIASAERSGKNMIPQLSDLIRLRVQESLTG